MLDKCVTLTDCERVFQSSAQGSSSSTAFPTLGTAHLPPVRRLTGVRWCLLGALMCVSLTTQDPEQLSVCLLAVSLSPCVQN